MTAPTALDTIAKLRELLAKLPEGEWCCAVYDSVSGSHPLGSLPPVAANVVGHGPRMHSIKIGTFIEADDMAFIAAAKNAMPLLLELAEHGADSIIADRARTVIDDYRQRFANDFGRLYGPIDPAIEALEQVLGKDSK